MSLSSKRVIKVRAPIRGVTVLRVTGNHQPEVATSPEAENFNSEFPPPETPTEETVQMTQSEFQQEIDFAYRRGMEEGKLIGYQQAEADYQKKIENMQKIAQSFLEERQRFFQESEEHLIQLTLKIARRILQELPPFLPKLIHHSIHKVLDLLGNESEILVHLNPDDYQDVEQLQQSIEKRLLNLEKLSFQPNPRISRGGCIIETPNTKIDARIETQMETLFQAIRKELETLQKDRDISHESGGES